MEEEKEKHKQDCLPSSVKKADDSVDVTQSKYILITTLTTIFYNN